MAWRVALAVSVALSSTAPVQAGLPRATAPDPADAASPYLLKIQSVDPGTDGGTDPGTGGDNGGGGNKGGRDPGRDGLGRPDRVEERRLTRGDIDAILKDIRSIRLECSNYDQVYRIDCLRQGIENVVARMPDTPEYRDAKQILTRASRQLNTIVTTYADPDAPKLEVPRTANPRFRTRRSYRAVKRTALPKALAKARAVVDEAATQLLRSAENSERRYAHYQQISTAIDSTKVLLRSG
jgi:hypothetical protein